MNLDRKTAPKTLVAANGDQIKDPGEKTIPSKTNDGIHRFIPCRSASVMQPLLSMQKVIRAGNTVDAADEFGFGEEEEEEEEEEEDEEEEEEEE